MGCKSISYWLGTFLFDYLAYLLTVTLFIVFFYVVKASFMYPFIGNIILIMICFGAALILFTYLVSFMFKNSNRAYKLFALIAFFGFYTLPGIILNVMALGFESEHMYRFFEGFFCICSPFYVVSNAFE